MRYLPLILLFLVGCGTPFRFHTIDTEFKPYIERYEGHKGSDIRGMSIIFMSIESPTIGTCWKNNLGYRKIEIDPKFWFRSSDGDRELLLFHELGHCDLGRGHASLNSIMVPSHFGASLYLSNKDYYISELFSPNSLDLIHTEVYDKVKGDNDGERTHDTCGAYRFGKDHIR